MCPECGTLVRATILAIVDPLASELRPIPRPGLIASGLILWAGGAAAAVMAAALPQAADLLALTGLRLTRPSAALGVTLGVGASMLGSLALIRPHAGIPGRVSLLAALGTLAYVPLLIVLWLYYDLIDASAGQRYLTSWRPPAEATRLSVAACALIAAIILGQRPAARILVARSLLLRTGRVDRQTLAAVAVAALVVGVGAALGPLTHASSRAVVESARILGVLLIALGSSLLTIGVLGSLLDASRIAQAIVFPRPTLRQVIREGHAPKPPTTALRVRSQTPPPPPSPPPAPRA
jgi:hypothetical protein